VPVVCRWESQQSPRTRSVVLSSVSAVPRLSVSVGMDALVLADNVVHLDPESATFEAMLEGWRRQQSARFLRAKTIATRSG
jgi:hypothetical protein